MNFFNEHTTTKALGGIILFTLVFSWLWSWPIAFLRFRSLTMIAPFLISSVLTYIFLLILGAILNKVASRAYDDRMPVCPRALARAGMAELPPTCVETHILMTDSTPMKPLCDILYVPFVGVVSIGDLCVLASFLFSTGINIAAAILA